MRRLLLLGAAVFCLAACQAAPESDASFNAKVKNYLLSHPDELRAAIQHVQELDQAKEDAAADVRARAALPALRAALEHDPRDFVANPLGTVTVTEFYDYRCPHCMAIAPRVVSLIRTHPEVRFVFKEMPIFGATSEHAARAAMAAKAQGKDCLGLYAAMMAARPLTDEAIDRLAAANGVSVAAMNDPAHKASDAAQLDDVNALATKLSITGTPGFIVGDTLIHGEFFEGLTAAIAAAEKKA
jgi:protein-disulfide isomerase